MNRRDDRQKLLNFPASEEFIEQINRGVLKSGIGDRSKFIRDAIREKLERMGIEVPVSMWGARSRFAKNPAPNVDCSTPEKPVAFADQKPPYGEAEPPPQNCPVSEAEKPPQPAAPKPSKIQRPKTP